MASTTASTTSVANRVVTNMTTNTTSSVATSTTTTALRFGIPAAPFLERASGGNTKSGDNDIRNILIFAAVFLFILFILPIPFRHRFPQIFHPKTYLGRRHERMKSPPRKPWQLLRTMFTTPHHEVIRTCGLDAFFFLRYIQFLFGLFLLLACFVLPILIPINLSGAAKQSSADPPKVNPTRAANITDELDRASMAHIDIAKHHLTWAHFVLAIVLIAIFGFAFLGELKYFIRIRQAWLHPYIRLDKRSSGTLLVTLIPSKLLNDRALTRYYAGFHGGVERVWINQDVGLLTKKIRERSNMIKLLEKLETELVVRVNAKAHGSLVEAAKIGPQPAEQRPDEQTQDDNATTSQPEVSEGGMSQATRPQISLRLLLDRQLALQPSPSWPVFAPPEEDSDSSEISNASATDTGLDPVVEKWTKWLKEKDRARVHVSHGRNWFIRLFNFLGHKEDAIVHCRHEIARLNEEIESLTNSDRPKLNSAFIRFKTRSGAALALTAPHDPRTMRVVAFEPSYEDIIWSNLGPGYFSHKARQLLNLILVTLLIVLYAVPVAFAAALSELDKTMGSLDGSSSDKPYMAWLQRHPLVVTLTQNAGPPMILWLARLIISPALCWFALRQGAPTHAHVQLMIQNGLFAFLFVQIFLIGSLTSATIHLLVDDVMREVVNGIGLFDFPSWSSKLPPILSREIPNTRNFFVGFLIVGFVTTAGSEFGQLANVFFSIWHWLRTALGKTRTPRQIYKRQHHVPECNLGPLYPLVTLYACITIAFSIYEPAVLGLAVLGFGLLWLGLGYSLLYCQRVHGSRHGTAGAMFIRAMNQLFCGVYVLEICLVGIFADYGRQLKVTGPQTTTNSTRATSTTISTTISFAISSGIPTTIPCDLQCTIPANNDTMSLEGSRTIHGALTQGIIMSIVFLLTACFQLLVNRWLYQVGMGLHTASDRRHEDLGVEESSYDTASVKDKEKASGWQWGRATGNLLRRRGGQEPEKRKEGTDYKSEILAKEDRGRDDYVPKHMTSTAWEQQVVWLPDDGEEPGIGRDESRLCCEAGVEAVLGGADLKEGTLVVEGVPVVVEAGLNFFISEQLFI